MSKKNKKPLKEITIAGHNIMPGERRKINIAVAPLYDFTEMTIPVEVIRGKKDGPVLFVSSAIHGDEINGTEIIKSLLNHKAMKKIRGTLIAVPIVNVFGFINKSRYLPDRRDLNRSFPGSERGSLAAQLAHIFMKEIVEKSTYGLDLHTAAIHRVNFPQVRADLSNEEVKRMAYAFRLPVILNSHPPEGSLRKEAAKKGVPVMVYEGGEALRFDERMIKTGLRGVISVLRELDMLPKRIRKTSIREKHLSVALSSYWIRAPHSGSVRVLKSNGVRVKKDELLGIISDPFGEHKGEIRTPKPGIIIGRTVLPLANEGDAMFHVATFKDTEVVEEMVGIFEDKMDNTSIEDVV